jgi:hypothetical protein
MKPVAEPVRTSRTRQPAAEPATLGRSAPKDPARDQARRQARDKDIKPTRSPGSSLGVSPAKEPSANRKPSRSGRSMKSRQSEPRASKSGKRKAKSQRTIKPPIVLMVVAAVVVVLGLILLPRAYQPSTQSAAAMRLPSVAKANLSARTVTQAVAPARTEGGATIISAQASQNRQPAMNLTPPREIEREQIVGVQSGIPPVILFRDGSKLNADPVTLEQLPADVRLQLTYNRSRP